MEEISLVVSTPPTQEPGNEAILIPRHGCRDKVWMEIAFSKLPQSVINGNKKLVLNTLAITFYHVI